MNILHERRKALGYMPLVGAAIIGAAAVGAGASASASRTQRNTARDVATANQWAAQVEGIQRQQQADQEREQTQRLQQDQQAFETERQNAQNEQARQLQESAAAAAAENTRQLEASARQTAADSAMSAQNQRVSDLTPTVELGGSTGTNSNSEARRRRATFRPEYTSGVTI